MLNIASNKKATHNYIIDEKYEVGLVLTGAEVKSLRLYTGSIKESYIIEKSGELWLTNCHIKKYSSSFVENYDPSLPKVFGNKAQLIQLFLNIIKNSCEEVDSDNGVIKITTKYEHSNLPLTIYIEDNGNGIPEHLKDNLFDTFVTNKINGRGLGLSISAKIVQSHFGSIIFDSYKGKTVFKVAFKHKG